jgi:hypothetical protein
VVYLDGAGATAAVVDAMALVDPGVTDTLTEVLVAGNTSGGTNIELSTTDKVQFRDAAIYLNSSVDGQLDIVADTEIQIAATTVDLNGNLDVSGTTVSAGKITADAGIDIDNINIDGTTIALSSGDLTLDVAGDIVLDAGGSEIRLSKAGTEFGKFATDIGTPSQFAISSSVLDGDIKLQGNDGGITITALTLDMSEAGAATFNSTIAATSATFTTADNLPQLTLISTDADAAVGPQLNLWRNSGSAANGDLIGQITFTGEDSLSNTITYASIHGVADQVDNGAEDGSIRFSTRFNDVLAEMLAIGSSTNGVTINDTGIDADFRVESDGNANMLFVDGGESAVGIGTATQYDGTALVSPLTISSLSGGNVLETFRGSASLFQLTMSTTGISSWNTSGSAAAHSFRTGTTVGTTSIKMYLGATGGLTMTPEAGGHTIFNEDGVDADFRVESDGNAHALFVDGGNDAVGLFTSAPATALDVRIGGAGTPASTVAPGTGAGIFLENNSTAEKPYFVSKTHNPGNNLAIGGVKFATSPDGTNYNWAGILGETSSSGNAGRLRFYTSAGNNSGDSSTLRMSIDESGNLLAGAASGSNHVIQKSAASTIVLNINNSSATAPSGTSFTFSAATPNNGTSTFFTTVDSTAYRGGWLSNGGVQNYQGNDSNLSDRREKTNFAPAKNYLETICAIPVQTFNYIDQNMEDDPSVTLGVVAQDVQTVAPELVTESNWGTASEPKMRLSIYQTDFQYALMKCIQEQQAIIEALTARIAALES